MVLEEHKRQRTWLDYLAQQYVVPLRCKMGTVPCFTTPQWEIKFNTLNDPNKGTSKYSKLQCTWWQQWCSCLKWWKVRGVSSRGSTMLHRHKGGSVPTPNHPREGKVVEVWDRTVQGFRKKFLKKCERRNCQHHNQIYQPQAKI